MSESAMQATGDVENAAQEIAPHVKRVLAALAVCGAVLDQHHGVDPSDDWDSSLHANVTVSEDYFVCVTAYAQLLSLADQQSVVGRAINAYLSTDKFSQVVRAEVRS